MYSINLFYNYFDTNKNEINFFYYIFLYNSYISKRGGGFKKKNCITFFFKFKKRKKNLGLGGSWPTTPSLGAPRWLWLGGTCISQPPFPTIEWLTAYDVPVDYDWVACVDLVTPTICSWATHVTCGPHWLWPRTILPSPLSDLCGPPILMTYATPQSSSPSMACYHPPLPVSYVTLLSLYPMSLLDLCHPMPFVTPLHACDPSPCVWPFFLSHLVVSSTYYIYYSLNINYCSCFLGLISLKTLVFFTWVWCGVFFFTINTLQRI